MDFDFLIIGAGVIGLAAAEYFSRNNLRVLVVEKENRIGTGVSSRNSEVIHAGIYYPPGSLKSILCIRGKNLLYEWCLKNNVPHKKPGKYIIAVNDSETEKLYSLLDNSFAAGMQELYFTDAETIMQAEPPVFCTGGLFSPTTGIISAHGFMDSLKYMAEINNTDFIFNSSVKSVSKKNTTPVYSVEIVDSTKEITRIDVGGVINCAGLYADQVARVIGGFDKSYSMTWIKGNYFRLKGNKGLFKHLIYPVPMPKLSGLGVHVTLDLENGIRFGPDVEDKPVSVEDYSINENKKDSFFNAVKPYFPAIKYDDLMPDMTGIRPRLAADIPYRDFIINEESAKGLENIVNCVGMESPGLTASLAIAEHIYQMLGLD